MTFLVNSIKRNIMYISIFCFVVLFVLTAILQSQFVYRTIFIQRIENVMDNPIEETVKPEIVSETPSSIYFGLCPDNKTPKIDSTGTNCENTSLTVKREITTKYLVSTTSILVFSFLMTIIFLSTVDI